ncbi:hypothetical protein M3Y97_01108300 [Aphelenchoides bicaudatus]|nr:hypothetical protein M3Y97_01108300 [Aphelenchoides bicaudatus]
MLRFLVFVAPLALFLIFAAIQVEAQYTPAVNTNAECRDSTKLDGTSDCAANSSWCSRNGWVDFMTRMCPRTCCRCVNRNLNNRYIYYGNYYPVFYGKRK